MINILIVDDDLNKISNIISSLKKNKFNDINIKQATSVAGAIELTKNNFFHLMITDLQMPYRDKEDLITNGGSILIKEIYKSNQKCKIPLFILGMTQFPELQNKFSDIWKCLLYDPSESMWETHLKYILLHIQRLDINPQLTKKETIFVEGITDKKILERSFELFYPQFKEKITIECVNFSGGASWVERQIIIWAKTLYRSKIENEYLKSIGLFDNDPPGIEAINNIRDLITNNSAESKTFHLIKYSQSEAKHLIPILKSGINIYIRLEEMLSIKSWMKAEEKGWLQNRDLVNQQIKEIPNWDKNSMSFMEFCNNLNLPLELQLFFKKEIKNEYKDNLVQYILNLDPKEQEEALYAFKILLEKILMKLSFLD